MQGSQSADAGLWWGRVQRVLQLPNKENRQLMFKCSELPDGSREGALKAVWGRGCRGEDQLVHSSRIGWHQGDVSSIINLLVSISLASLFLRSAVFIWWGSASCKNNLGMCVKPLTISFKELGVPWFWCVAELYSKLLPIHQPNSYSLFLHLHIS